jgi:hypothetical protein
MVLGAAGVASVVVVVGGIRRRRRRRLRDPEPTAASSGDP